MRVGAILFLGAAMLVSSTARALSQVRPPSPAATAAPLRRLVYAMQVDYFASGEGHDSGMTPGGTGGNGSGVQAILGSGGRRGTIEADVLALAPHDGLIVAVDEMLYEAARPRQRFTCLVYGSGQTYCPDSVGALSDAENLLLSLLGRGFVDPSVTAPSFSWQRAYHGKDVSVRTTYAMTDPKNGLPVTIVMRSKIVSAVPNVGNTSAHARITYDRAMSVPDAIHEVAREQLGGSLVRTTIDLRLTSDSFARQAAPKAAGRSRGSSL